MSSRWKKVWADLWGSKSRTILTILTILVGTFAVGFNSNLALYMLDSMDGDYLSANPSEASVSAFPLTDQMVEIARAMPGVDAAEGLSITSAQVLHPGLEPITIQITMLNDPRERTLNTLKPARGEDSIPSLGEREVLLDASAATLGYRPGDKITIQLSDGKIRQLVFAGYMHDVTGIPYNLTQLLGAYVTPKTIEWLGGTREYNVMAISVSERQTDQQHVTQVAQSVADRLERAGATVYFVSAFRPGHHFAYSIVQSVFLVLGLLSYLTVLLSAVLIINTITALMTQQTRHIGIMKAVGGGNLQIFFMYAILVLCFGLMALLLAVPLSNSAAQTIGRGMAEYLNFYTRPFRPYTITLVQQGLIALVVPLLAALWPIYRSVRVTVREAISDYGIGGSVKPKDSSVSRAVLLLPRPMRLSLRNAFRRRARLLLTLFALVLAGGIFIGVFNLWETFNKSMTDVQGYFLADINLSFGRYYRLEEVASLAQNVPGVVSVEGWTEIPATLIRSENTTGTQVVFMAPPSDSTLIKPVIASGRWLKPGDENAVVIGNYLLSMFPDLKVGDWLTLKIDEKETRWHVVGVYTITGNTGVPLMYVNYEYLSRLIGLPGQVYSLRILTTQHDAISQKSISDQIVSIYKARGIQYSSTQLGADWLKSQTSQTDILIYFLLVMSTLIAVVGGLGMMGTMSINVMERTREIGVMRAIGASNGDIQSIVIVEGIVVGLISWAISILLSIPITGVLAYGVGMAILTAPMTPVFGIRGILAWMVFTLVIAVVASAMPAHRASTLTVRDTLAYE